MCACCAICSASDGYWSIRSSTSSVRTASCSATLVSSSSFVIDQDRPDPCRGAAPDRDPFHVPDPSRPYRPCAASFPDARGRRRRELPSVRACFLGPPSWRESEEHTSELQSPMRTSLADFCLTKKNNSSVPPH